jgi:hypothetical protein
MVYDSSAVVRAVKPRDLKGGTQPAKSRRGPEHCAL